MFYFSVLYISFYCTFFFVVHTSHFSFNIGPDEVISAFDASAAMITLAPPSLTN